MKLSELDNSEMVGNIIEIYNSATDADRKSGASWYSQAKFWSENTARAYGYTVEQVAGVIAALSPMRDWYGNLVIAERAIAVHKDIQRFKTKSVRDRRFHETKLSFTNNNDKAYAILETGELDSLFASDFTGLKVQNFVLNILGSENAITVDRWAFRIACPDIEYASLNGKLYNAVAEAYRNAADELGIAPSALQAITWVYIRNRETASQS